MDDLDRLLAESMRDAEVRAPSDAGLLDAVHRRSDRHRRRRTAAGLSALAVVLAAGIPAAAQLVTRSPAPAPPAGTVPVVSVPPPVSASPPPAAIRSTPPQSHAPKTPTAKGVHLAAGYTPPAFPYTLPAAAGLAAPVASMVDGNLVAFFEATDPRTQSDTTVTVSSRRPSFSGSATETPMRVRGHAGTLRTVAVQPADQLTLYCPESAGRWIQVATDNTYSPQQVAALAEGLTPAAVAVLPPFRLDLSPAGFVTETITESTMSFRAPNAGRITVVLRKRRLLPAADRKVGGYDASLTHDGDGAVLRVDVTDWDATLEVTVGGGVALSDADLLRFAAGVHILNRSNPK